MLERSLEQQAQKLLRHKPGSVGAVFLTRALRAFEGLTRELPKQALSDAASASSDLEVVLRALLAAPGLVARAARDPLAPARLRGRQAQRGLLESEGGTVSATEVAEQLGISRQAINKRRQAGQLLALPLGRRFAYPVWQLSGNGVLSGFAAALEKLAGHDTWMQARFFLGRSKLLGGARPLDELRRGNVEPVLRAAEAYGEQGPA